MFVFLVSGVFGQTTRQLPASLHIKKAIGRIKLDGALNEPDWKAAEKVGDFWQNYPSDTSFAITRTDVCVTYDAQFLYIGATCYDNLEGDYVIQSLKRDFSYPISDAFAVYIDPFNDKTNGFNFTVNPLGVQREGLIAGGGTFGVTTSWDNKWFSKVVRHSDKWVVEMAIPFKTLRYKEGLTQWGINFSRNDLKRNENSSWSAVPKNFNIASLAFTGVLLWDESPHKAGANISLIPYGITGLSSDYKAGSSSVFTGNSGGDAKIAVTSSLNLDLTINPDFSQVEVDAQQTNLTRFNLFFPEKRQFFIENSDLFGEFGFRQIRPFFSRNIGLSKGQAVPIIGGARLSGRVNENWRIGLMNMQTARDSSIGNMATEGQNYTVAAFQRKVLKRSNIAGIFVNRQGFTGNELHYSDYNRIAGLDFNYASANEKLIGKAFYHQSFYTGAPSSASANATFLFYSTGNLSIMWNHEYVNKDYIADVGWVPRNKLFNPNIGAYQGFTYFRLEPTIKYKFFPKKGPVNWHGPGLYVNNYYDENLSLTDHFYMPHYVVNFRNTSEFQVHYHEYYTHLTYDFNVFNNASSALPAGNYAYRNLLLKFTTNQRKKLYGMVASNYGSFYNGTKLTVRGNLNFRKQPWGIFSINFEQNEINLPDSFGSSSISLIGPKIQLSFTKAFFFTTFIQYNTQMDNININSRFQWRFRPMSDLYIVYTDNYDAFLNVKNRALVVKLVYWLTM